MCLCEFGYRKNNSVCEGIIIVYYFIYCTNNNADIDECAITSCGLNAKCTNTIGSFQCSCAPGYVGIAPLCLGGCFNYFIL